MKLILELLPLIAFFICYKLYGIIGATTAIIIGTFISVIAHYLIYKSVAKSMLISSLLVIVLGSITVFSGNTNFIKLKPTIFSVIVSLVLLYGLIKRKYYIKLIFAKAINMPDSAWAILSKRTIIFFSFIACLNEIIWRFFSEEYWVSFKVFGVLPLFIVFMLLQLPLINKYNLNTK